MSGGGIVGDLVGIAAGAALGPAGFGITASLGGALGGAVAGGLQDGFSGALQGGLMGFSVGAPIGGVFSDLASGVGMSDTLSNFATNIGFTPSGGVGLDSAGNVIPPLTDAASSGGSILDRLKSGFSNLMPGETGGIPTVAGGASRAGGVGGISSLMNVGTSLYGLQQAKQLQKQANQYASNADPMAGQRGAYLQQLQQLESNPSMVTSTPGYQAGLEAVQRSMAAQGYSGSGNMMAELQKYGQNAYNQRFQELATLAGANATPGAGGQLALEGSTAGLQAQISALNRLGTSAAAMGF